jgi:hypothetical protein
MLVEEMLGDIAAEQLWMPPARASTAQPRQAPVDTDAIAIKVLALIKDDLQKLVHNHQHTQNVPLPDANSIVRDAIRQVMPEYREGR